MVCCIGMYPPGDPVDGTLSRARRTRASMRDARAKKRGAALGPPLMHSLLAEARRRWLPCAAFRAAVFAFRCARTFHRAIFFTVDVERVPGGDRCGLNFVFVG